MTKEYWNSGPRHAFDNSTLIGTSQGLKYLSVQMRTSENSVAMKMVVLLTINATNQEE